MCWLNVRVPLLVQLAGLYLPSRRSLSSHSATTRPAGRSPVISSLVPYHFPLSCTVFSLLCYGDKYADLLSRLLSFLKILQTSLLRGCWRCERSKAAAPRMVTVWLEKLLRLRIVLHLHLFSSSVEVEGDEDDPDEGGRTLRAAPGYNLSISCCSRERRRRTIVTSPQQRCMFEPVIKEVETHTEFKFVVGTLEASCGAPCESIHGRTRHLERCEAAA